MSLPGLLARKAFFPEDGFPGQSQTPRGCSVAYSTFLLFALLASEGWSQFFRSSQDTNGHVLAFPMTPPLENSKEVFLFFPLKVKYLVICSCFPTPPT